MLLIHVQICFEFPSKQSNKHVYECLRSRKQISISLILNVGTIGFADHPWPNLQGSPAHKSSLIGCYGRITNITNRNLLVTDRCVYLLFWIFTGNYCPKRNFYYIDVNELSWNGLKSNQRSPNSKLDWIWNVYVLIQNKTNY